MASAGVWFRTLENLAESLEGRRVPCQGFLFSLVNGTGGTASCDTAMDSGCLILCAMGYGWRVAEREALAMTRIQTANGPSDLRPHSNPIFPNWRDKRQSDGKYATPSYP
jgi:hypothetical protein